MLLGFLSIILQFVLQFEDGCLVGVLVFLIGFEYRLDLVLNRLMSLLEFHIGRLPAGIGAGELIDLVL